MNLKNIFVPAFLIAGLALVASCGEKKEPTKDIIAPKPVVKAPAKPVKMSPFSESKSVEWAGGSYMVEIKRSVIDDSQPFEDVNGNKYYDNRVTLRVTGPGGSDFFSHEYTKESFPQIIDAGYLKNTTLLSISFDEVEGGKLKFIGSVGCPDDLSDDYVPLEFTLSRDGHMSVTKGKVDI